MIDLGKPLKINVHYEIRNKIPEKIDFAVCGVSFNPIMYQVKYKTLGAIKEQYD